MNSSGCVIAQQLPPHVLLLHPTPTCVDTSPDLLQIVIGVVCELPQNFGGECNWSTFNDYNHTPITVNCCRYSVTIIFFC